MLVAVTAKASSSSLAPLDVEQERALLARCRLGERAAQDELYHRFRRQVAGNLYRMLGERRELEDLVQEVFVIAFRGLEGFRGEARLATWIYRICINVGLGRMRSNRRRPAAIGVTDLDATAAAQADSLVQPIEGPERAAERSDAARLLYAAMDQLPPAKRVVVYLHEIEGRDLKEIAYLVEANAVTVRTRLFYARRELYRILSELAPGRAAAEAP